MVTDVIVYGLYKSEMHLPFLHEELLGLYEDEATAQQEADRLNAENDDPIIEDCYGIVAGREFKIYKLEIKK